MARVGRWKSAYHSAAGTQGRSPHRETTFEDIEPLGFVWRERYLVNPPLALALDSRGLAIGALLPAADVHSDSSITSTADTVAKFALGSKVRLSLPSEEGSKCLKVFVTAFKLPASLKMSKFSSSVVPLQ